MIRNSLFLFLSLLSFRVTGQDVVVVQDDSLNQLAHPLVSIGGYVDTYYGYDFNKPASGNRDYFVNMARNNEASINLAYLDLRLNSTRLRARLVPGFGTYMKKNYAAEPKALRNIVEGSVGFRLSKKKDVWLEGGILSSPFTNEGVVSRDQLMYTRSIAAEYVPYYLMGLKLSYPINTQFKIDLYLINGWQQIKDQNNGKSIGTQLEFKLNGRLAFSWTTYLGDERSPSSPLRRTRYYTDIFFTYRNDRFAASGCAYSGIQNRETPNGTFQSSQWWQANLIGQYRINRSLSIAGRIEYFSDPQSAVIIPVTGITSFSTYGSGLCMNLKILPLVLLRFEGRTFFSGKEVYLDNSTPSRTSNLAISNLTVWF